MDRNNIEAYALYEDVVALRKESVDRNYDVDEDGKCTGGRSPQGERG